MRLRIVWLAALILVVGCGEPVVPRPTLTSADVYRSELQRERSELGAKLDDADALVDALARTEDATQRMLLMRKLVVSFSVHLGDGSQWEERLLYDSADQRMGGAAPFTAALRVEHRVIARWIADLARLSTADPPDVAGFVRTAHRIVGVARANLEAEGEILLPLVGGALSSDELQRARGKAAVPHAPPPRP